LFLIVYAARNFITLAGTPPNTAFDGIDLATTAPAAIMQLSPILNQSSIVTLAPIQQFFPILIPLLFTP
jgi:hypothetical protein